MSNGEACDDGNTSTCGTCNTLCTREQLAPARGRIQTVPGDSHRDGDHFYLSDGIDYVAFEFDRNGTLNDPTRVRITYTNTLTDAQMAQAIVTAIQGAANFGVTATTQAGTRVVDLVNDLNGTSGNEAIFDQVNPINFRLEGMSGGEGVNCPLGTRCTSNNDCEPGLVCGAGQCRLL
jgi:hypothetical protein